MANLVILNKIKATAHIFDCVAPENTKNGYLVKLGAQKADKTYNVSANTNKADKGLAMVLNVNLPYEADKLENEAEIATGEVVRAYIMELGNVVSIPVANIEASADIEAENFVIPEDGKMKMESADSLDATASVAFVIDEVFTKAGVPMAKLRCIVADN